MYEDYDDDIRRVSNSVSFASSPKCLRQLMILDYDDDDDDDGDDNYNDEDDVHRGILGVLTQVSLASENPSACRNECPAAAA